MVYLNFTELNIPEDEFEIVFAYAPWILDEYWQDFIALLLCLPIIIFMICFTLEFVKLSKMERKKQVIVHKYGVNYT